MLTKLSTSVLVCLAATVGMSGAQDNSGHRFIPVSSGGTEIVYLNTKTLTSDGDTTIAWGLYVFSVPRNFNGDKLVSYALLHERYSCSSRSSAVDSMAAYDDSGELVTVPFSPTSFTPVAPDSVGDVMLNMACGGWSNYRHLSAPNVKFAVEVARRIMAEATASPP